MSNVQDASVDRHENPGLLRSGDEARFCMSLVPCDQCGSRDSNRLAIKSTRADDGVSPLICWFSGPCPQCDRMRSFRFREPSDLFFGWERVRHELGGASPSEVILPDEFVREADRVAPEVLGAPETLEYDSYDRSWAALRRSLTCWNELRKFLAPEGEIPEHYFRTEASRAFRDANRARFSREAIAHESARLEALYATYKADLPRFHAMCEVELAKKPPPAPRGKGLDRVALESHRLWVKHGDEKGHRIELSDVDASRMRLSAIELSGTILTRVNLTEADLSVSELRKARWTEVQAPRARLGSALMAGSTLVHCDFTEAGMSLTKLGDSVIQDCAFDRATLDRSTWYRCDVERSTFCGAAFGQASLDDAVFVDCDFRGASFAMNPEGVLGGASFTWFIRCDLRDTDWTGRWVHHTVFEDCLVAGVHGTPREVAYIHVIRPSFSVVGAATPGKGHDDLVAAWGYTGKQFLALPGGPVDRKRSVNVEVMVDGEKRIGYMPDISPLLKAERARRAKRGDGA